MVEKKNTEPEALDSENSPKAPGLGIDQNLALVLAYLFFALGGIIFYVLEKENKQIRFAAMQSILFTVAIIAIFLIGGLFVGIFAQIGGFIAVAASFAGTIFLIGILAVWGLLIYRSLKGEEWELPLIGKIARNTIK